MIYTNSNLAAGGVIAGFKDVLLRAGIIETMYYETATSLIFKLTMFPQVFRFTYASTSVYVYAGDGYTSGSTANNEIVLANYGSTGNIATANPLNLISTPNVVAFAFNRDTTDVIHIVICKQEDLTTLAFISISAASTLYAKGIIRNLSLGTNLSFIYPRTLPILSNDGYWYEMDVYLKEQANNIFQQGKPIGVKYLTRDVAKEQLTIFGNDVAIPLYHFYDLTHSPTITLLIKNGAI